jgi:putative FmdB family regulatory protein
MPIYTYQHNEPSECDEPLEVFQHMNDDHLAECPLCKQPVYRVITSCNFKVKNSAPSAANLAQREYGLKRGEQGYIVPMSGEMIRTEGMSKREKQVAVWQGHQRAGDPRVEGTGPESVTPIE